MAESVFAFAHADQNEIDYESFKSAIDTGRISATEG
jgi:hypothetical protein